MKIKMKLNFKNKMNLEKKSNSLIFASKNMKDKKDVSSFTKNSFLSEKINFKRKFFQRKSSINFFFKKSFEKGGNDKSNNIFSKFKRVFYEKYNYLWIIFWVKKFIEILKTAIIIRKLKKLKNYHLNLIGDSAYFKYFLINISKRIHYPINNVIKLKLFFIFFLFLKRKQHVYVQKNWVI